MSNYFRIRGYWKDDGEKFDGYIVKETSDYTEEEDDQIFFFGLSEENLKEAVKEGQDWGEDFIITGYEKMDI